MRISKDRFLKFEQFYYIYGTIYNKTSICFGFIFMTHKKLTKVLVNEFKTFYKTYEILLCN